MNEVLQEKLRLLPDRPGVYLMKDEQGAILYVGKALSLKNRVRSYFQSSRSHPPKTLALVEKIVDLETIITDSEVEALILESNLIKKYSPHYNVRLKDDKHYPYVQVTLGEEFPRIRIVRRVADDGHRYFGPYTNSNAIRSVINLVHRFFPIRDCNLPLKEGELNHRPCLNHHIHRCGAPCAGKISREEYRQLIQEACLFLEGRSERLLPHLKSRMDEAAQSLRYEEAAKLRDEIRALEEVASEQKTSPVHVADQDVLGLAQGRDVTVAQIFFVRGGKLLGREHFLLEAARGLDPGEVLEAFLGQYYQDAPFIPREILLPQEIQGVEVLETWLSERRGRRVYIRRPLRGEKHRLVQMVEENARLVLGELEARADLQRTRNEEALAGLQEALDLPRPPGRIECFDISNTQGSQSVASMVVFEAGKPKPSEYRRFKIKTVEGPDDFASMAEVIRRRFEKGRIEEEAIERGELAPEKAKFRRLPDLLVVDGGKGQLSSARKVMREMGVDGIPTIGLAKEFEEIIREGVSGPLRLSADSQSLYLLQRIRDEAHRFAITYHRSLRGKRLTRSTLDQIPGIGPARKRALLRHFGSVGRIAEASVEELQSVEGVSESLAREIYQFWQGEDSQ